MSKESTTTSPPHAKNSKFKEYIFFTGSIVVVPLSLVFLVQFFHVVEQRNNERPDLNLPRFSHFFPTLIYWILFFIVLRYVTAIYIFPKIGKCFIPEKKWKKEIREEKITRFGHVFFKFVFFTLISAYGYFLLRNKEWIPPIAGGYGSTKECWTNYPWDPVEDDIKQYYLIQLAYHTHSLIFQFLLKKRADFLEMCLHHLVTIFLLSFSYLNNYLRIGTLVLLVHDISDIFSYLIKSTVDSQSRVLNIISYSCLLLSWGFGRLFVFPFYIMRSTFFESTVIIPEQHLHGFFFFNLLMICLLCLHIYWYTMFIYLGLRFYNSGKIQDSIEDGADKRIDPTLQFNKTNGLKDKKNVNGSIAKEKGE